MTGFSRSSLAFIAFLAAPMVLLACGSGSGSTGTGGGSAGSGGSSSAGTGGSSSTTGTGGSSSSAGGMSGTGGDASTSSSTAGGGGGTPTMDYCPGFIGSCNVAAASQCADMDGTDANALKSACENAGGTWSTTDHCPDMNKAFGCGIKGDLGNTATCKTQWYYKPLNMSGSGSVVCPNFGPDTEVVEP